MATICLRRRLPGASSDRYPRARRATVNALLFGLAPGGVYLAGRSPGRRWALTPPFHPYLAARLRRFTLPGGFFLWHFPSGRPDWVLPSALLCGARTFLQRYLLRRRSPVRLGPAIVYPPNLVFLTCSSIAMFTSLSAPRFSSRGMCLTITLSPNCLSRSVACRCSSISSGSLTFHPPFTCSTTSLESRYTSSLSGFHPSTAFSPSIRRSEER